MPDIQNTSRSVRPRSGVRAAAAAAFAIALTLAAGCGDDDSTATTEPGTVTISGQWARTSPSMVTAGAAYLTITSPVDDKLLAASADAALAGSVELHETFMMEGEATGTTTGMGGEMGMRPVEFVELPAGQAVELEPGGYHIMMLDLVAPLESGTTISLTLTFELAGDVVIDVPVLDEAPG